MIEAQRFDDNKGNRFYWFLKDGKIEIAAGITTVFGKVIADKDAIDNWKENNKNWKDLLDWSSSYGSIQHGIFEDIMTKGDFNRGQVRELEEIIGRNGGSRTTPSKDILAFMRFLEEHTIEPIEIEKVLVWQCPKTGGYLAMTMDLLCNLKAFQKVKVQTGVFVRGKNKGEPKYKTETQLVSEVANVDWKSNYFEKDSKSYYEAHKMQLIGTKRAVEQNFGIKVDNVYNWSPKNWDKEPDYTFKKWEITEEDERLFDLYFELAVLKGHNIPKGSIFMTDFKGSKDYRRYSYKEYVHKFLLKQ